MPVTCTRRNLVVLIVFIALLLDNLLLTCVVPIIPNYLRKSETATNKYDDHHNTPTTAPTPFGPMHQLDGFPNGRSTFPWIDIEHANRTCNATVVPKENTRMGLLIGVKTFTQLVFNFGVGLIINKVGYTIPMFSGFVILLGSTVLFAFADTYILLFVARAIQGVGTALSTTSGMGLLAKLFPDQKERGLAQTIAFSGLAAGVLIGPPYGGLLYYWTGGKETPCLILAWITLLEGVLQLLVMRPRYHPEDQKGVSFIRLLMDPYILLTIGCITVSSLTVAVLEPVLPIWMYHTMGASSWLQGVAFVPSTLSYLLCLQIFGAVTHRSQSCTASNSWISAFVGVLFLGVSITAVPFCKDVYELIGPLFVNGFGLALVSSSMLPHVGYLVDQRHEPSYGNAYALADNAFCIAFAIGPAVSGPLVDSVGFSWTMISLGILCVVFAPMACLLRNTARKEQVGVDDDEETPLLPKIVAISSSTLPHADSTF